MRKMKSAVKSLRRKRRREGRTRKRRRRAQSKKEVKQPRALQEPWAEEMITKIKLLKVTMITERIMIALLVLKILNSKRISNSSRCDCSPCNCKAACWAVRDPAGVSQEGSGPTSPKIGFALSESSAKIILFLSLSLEIAMIFSRHPQLQ